MVWKELSTCSLLFFLCFNSKCDLIAYVWTEIYAFLFAIFKRIKMPGASGVWELWSPNRVSRFLITMSKNSMWGIFVLQPVLEKFPKNQKITS